MIVKKQLAKSKYPPNINWEVDVANHDTLAIKSEPRQVETKYGVSNVLEVETQSGDLRSMWVRGKNWNAIWDMFGADTVNWLDKTIEVDVALLASGKYTGIVKFIKQ